MLAQSMLWCLRPGQQHVGVIPAHRISEIVVGLLCLVARSQFSNRLKLDWELGEMRYLGACVTKRLTCRISLRIVKEMS
jgi:hypothetical protein